MSEDQSPSTKFQNNKKRTASSFIKDRSMSRKDDAALFVGQYEDTAILHQEIQGAVTNTAQITVTRTESKALVKEAKRTFQEERKSTSMQTILAITNTMVGSAVLVLPQNFLKGGFIMSLLVMTVMGVVSYFTCAYIVQCQRQGETDFSDIIKRTLSRVWARGFLITSFLLMFFVGIVYFLLQNQVCFGFIKFMVWVFSGDIISTKSTEISWTTFSIQYNCIGLAPFVFMLVMMRELTPLIRLAKYGVIAILAYGVFILYIFFESVTSSTFTADWHKNMELFTTDFAGVAGNFSLAFFLHNCICQITANNLVQKNNQRDLAVGYVNVYAIYGLVGSLGSIGLLKVYNPETNANSICDYFQANDIPAGIVNLLFLLQLSTVLPVIAFITRVQFFTILQGSEVPITKMQHFIFNLVFMATAVVFQLLTVSPSLLIGVAGAICGFYIVYILPFAIRFAASQYAKKYGEQVPPRVSAVSGSDDYRQGGANHQSVYSTPEGASYIDASNNAVQQDTQIDSSQFSSIDASLMVDGQEILHQTAKPFNGQEGGILKPFEYALWSFIVVIGVAMAIVQFLGIAGVID